MFLAIRKLRLESASQQLAHHKILARWNARLSLPPIFSACGLAHRLTCLRQFAVHRRTAQSGGSGQTHRYCGGAAAAGVAG